MTLNYQPQPSKEREIIMITSYGLTIGFIQSFRQMMYLLNIPGMPLIL